MIDLLNIHPPPQQKKGEQYFKRTKWLSPLLDCIYLIEKAFYKKQLYLNLRYLDFCFTE